MAVRMAAKRPSPVDREEKYLEQHRGGYAKRKERLRRDRSKGPERQHNAVLRHVALRKRSEVGSGQHGHHRRLERGVRPVVHHPAEDFTAIVGRMKSVAHQRG